MLRVNIGNKARTKVLQDSFVVKFITYCSCPRWESAFRGEAHDIATALGGGFTDRTRLFHVYCLGLDYVDGHTASVETAVVAESTVGRAGADTVERSG